MEKLIAKFRAWVEAKGDKHFASDDMMSWCMGWEIKKTHWHLGRVYHNPRFDDEYRMV